jgi:hypothetical protein
MIASLAMCIKFLFSVPDNEAYIVYPSIAFGLSALFAGIGSVRNSKIYDIFGDSIPLPAFFLAYILSGNSREWVIILFVLSLASSILVFVFRERAEYDAEDDILRM